MFFGIRGEASPLFKLNSMEKTHTSVAYKEIIDDNEWLIHVMNVLQTNDYDESTIYTIRLCESPFVFVRKVSNGEIEDTEYTEGVPIENRIQLINTAKTFLENL